MPATTKQAVAQLAKSIEARLELLGLHLQLLRHVLGRPGEPADSRSRPRSRADSSGIEDDG
jgi:hypothetical protein